MVKFNERGQVSTYRMKGSRISLDSVDLDLLKHLHFPWF